MNYEAARKYLFSLKGRGSKYGIDRIRLFVERLGHPERKLNIIHVSGTNGKGSVCAMCEAILREAGYRTGMYTSPHLVRLGERIQVNRELISENEIVRYTLLLKEVAEEIAAGSPDDHPTFFEFMTAMSFLYFVERQVDVAVIEVGMGGRLDATNVVDSLVTAVTSISLDHCEQLGFTHASIAREEAGIIKPATPVIVGRVDAEARQVIEELARERNAPLRAIDDIFGDSPGRRPWPTTRLEGDHQRLNAATTLLVLEAVKDRFPVTPTQIQAGLSRVEWAGRWDRRRIGGRDFIFEAAHNPEGAEVLDRQLSKLFAETGRKPLIAAGALGERRARALFEVIARHAREIFLLVPDQPRATPFETLEEFIPRDFSGLIHRCEVREAFSPKTGFSYGDSDDTVVVTGSIYLIGEIMERLEGKPVGEGILQG